MESHISSKWGPLEPTLPKNVKSIGKNLGLVYHDDYYWL